MTDHDQLIKSLIKHFFKEYLELFFPDLASRLYLDSPEFPVTFLDKQHFTDIPKGRRRDVDILARVWTRDETIETILVHSEHQEADRHDPDEAAMPFLDRMFFYSLLLQLRHQEDHIIPIVLWFVPGKGGLGIETRDRRLMGAGLQLTYYRLCVPDLDAEEYLNKDNPLGHGLAARMRRGRLSPVRLSLACRSRIVRAPISDVKKLVLLDIVQTYVKLNQKEEAEMQAILEDEPEYKDVKWEDLTYYGQVEARAMAKGRASDILMILDTRGISVGGEARQQILRCTDLALLELWLKRAVVAHSADEVLKPTP